MKIYEKVVIDMSTMDVVEEVSHEYEGPMALCCGGGSPDPPPPPPEPPKPVHPQDVKAETTQVKTEQRRRAAAATGVQAGILTSGLGLAESAKTTKKTLMGQ